MDQYLEFDVVAHDVPLGWSEGVAATADEIVTQSGRVRDLLCSLRGGPASGLSIFTPSN
jgi:hypothetical protein